MRRLAMRGILLGGMTMALPAAGDDHGLRTHGLDAAAHVGPRALGPARLELSCRGGKGGSLALRLVLPAAAAAAFPLDAFEGPDGVGGSRDLAEWGIDTRAASTRLSSGIGGWYDAERFVLATEAIQGRPAGELVGFVRRLVNDDLRRLRLSLAPPRSGEPLQAEAEIAPADRAALRAAAADCLVPP